MTLNYRCSLQNSGLWRDTMPVVRLVPPSFPAENVGGTEFLKTLCNEIVAGL